MILEEILCEHDPEMFGYMIIEKIYVCAGDRVSPGSKLLLVNTKRGKYRILSPCTGTIDGALPAVGDRIGVDDLAVLYIQVEQPLSDEEREPVLQKAASEEAAGVQEADPSPVEPDIPEEPGIQVTEEPEPGSSEIPISDAPMLPETDRKPEPPKPSGSL